MQVNVNRPSTIYIQFVSEFPKTFTLFNDEGNKYYYRHLDGKTPRIKFNVPDVGIYNSNVNFEISKIVDIEIPTLPNAPTAERDRFKQSEIVFNNQLKETPCRIYTDLGIIEVGYSFYQYPEPVRLFLLLHEQGHYFYLSELKCDIYAMINFLRMGYNRATAFYTLQSVMKRNAQHIAELKRYFHIQNVAA